MREKPLVKAEKEVERLREAVRQARGRLWEEMRLADRLEPDDKGWFFPETERIISGESEGA